MTYSKNPAVLRVLSKIAGLPFNLRLPPGLTQDAADAAIEGAGRQAFYKTPEFLGSVAAAAVPFALEKGYGGVRKMLQSRQKAHAFKETLEQNPGLKKRDANLTQRYFNTLWRTNPEMAKDPTIASAFITNHVDAYDKDRPTAHPFLLQGSEQMANIRRHMMSARPQRTTFSGVGGPVKAMVEHGANERERERIRGVLQKARGQQRP